VVDLQSVESLPFEIAAASDVTSTLRYSLRDAAVLTETYPTTVYRSGLMVRFFCYPPPLLWCGLGSDWL